jgi:hypothetical protein
VSRLERLAVQAHVVLRVPVGDVVCQRGRRPLDDAGYELQGHRRGPVVDAFRPVCVAADPHRPAQAVVRDSARLVPLVGDAVDVHPFPEAVSNPLKILLQQPAARFLADREQSLLALGKSTAPQNGAQKATHLPHRIFHFGLGEQLRSGQCGHGDSFRRSCFNNRSTEEPPYKLTQTCSRPCSETDPHPTREGSSSCWVRRSSGYR